MQFDNRSGWLKGTDIRHCLSPFFNERPESQDIDLLVIHNISLPPGEFGTPYIDQLFTGCLQINDHPFFESIAHAQVSSHFLIDRQGSITQYVSVYKRAWHAGQSHYQGRDNCNDFAIGIELEGSDYTPFTDQQYVALIGLCQLLINQLPYVSAQRITGHSDIAPGRKTDPGPYFDWQRLQKGLSS